MGKKYLEHKNEYFRRFHFLRGVGGSLRKIKTFETVQEVLIINYFIFCYNSFFNFFIGLLLPLIDI